MRVEVECGLRFGQDFVPDSLDLQVACRQGLRVRQRVVGCRGCQLELLSKLPLRFVVLLWLLDAKLAMHLRCQTAADLAHGHGGLAFTLSDGSQLIVVARLRLHEVLNDGETWLGREE